MRGEISEALEVRVRKGPLSARSASSCFGALQFNVCRVNATSSLPFYEKPPPWIEGSPRNGLKMIIHRAVRVAFATWCTSLLFAGEKNIGICLVFLPPLGSAPRFRIRQPAIVTSHRTPRAPCNRQRRPSSPEEAVTT